MTGFVRNLLLICGAIAATAATGGVLFLAAGRWDVPIWWAYLAVMLVLSSTALLTMDAGLLRERLRPGPGGTDAVVIHAGKLLLLTHLLMAGADVGRFHRSTDVPFALQVGALAMFAVAMGLMVWAMAVNRFFSPLIRLQSDRGHTIVTTGPYRFVRHPGYTGACVGMLLSGVALGSWLSTLPMILMVIIIIRRVVLEDRFLQSELDGYRDYAGDVRFRLVPGVW